jgi:MFS transporter, DHA2 family, multidrug resistance protein
VILSLPPSRRTMGMALFSITATFAPAIGPTVGGYLTETFHWPVIFFLNVVPGAFMLFTVVYAIEKDKADFSLLGKVDYWGIGTMALGLSSLTIFLEEGERKDWFGSNLIVVLALSSFVFLAAFLYVELTTKEPFINLRLLKQRNFGLGCLVNVVIGLAMYGALYLLPMYLSTIARYNSVYIGKTMMWAGLPQLLIIPFVPKLLKRFDSRFVAFVGINIFAASCIMNTSLTHLVGLEQLKWSQMVRAIGQPLLMVPLSTITMGLVAREQSGSASGLFNMLRNLGGSVGIALLSTLLTVREKFHSAKIGEGISIYHRATRERLAGLQAGFVSHGFDPATSMKKALMALDGSVRQEAYVTAFNDCFLAVGVALIFASCLILLCKKVAPAAGPSEAH